LKKSNAISKIERICIKIICLAVFSTKLNSIVTFISGCDVLIPYYTTLYIIIPISKVHEIH